MPCAWADFGCPLHKLFVSTFLGPAPRQMKTVTSSFCAESRDRERARVRAYSPDKSIFIYNLSNNVVHTYC